MKCWYTAVSSGLAISNVSELQRIPFALGTCHPVHHLEDPSVLCEVLEPTSASWTCQSGLLVISYLSIFLTSQKKYCSLYRSPENDEWELKYSLSGLSHKRTILSTVLFFFSIYLKQSYTLGYKQLMLQKHSYNWTEQTNRIKGTLFRLLWSIKMKHWLYLQVERVIKMVNHGNYHLTAYHEPVLYDVSKKSTLWHHPVMSLILEDWADGAFISS